MFLRRIFGGPSTSRPDDRPATQPAEDALAVSQAETQSIRRISGQLEALPIEERRFVAGFAYVLGRAAHADLHFDADELAFIERTVQEIGHLTEAQAVLVVEIARSQEELYGATEDYLVTREFARLANREQRMDLLRTAFAVGAADGSITGQESAELNQIGKELGFVSEEVDRIRAEFTDQLAAIQKMRRMTSAGASSETPAGDAP
jgi:tellurite resistance protein